MEDITIHTAAIKNITREYYKQFYANKFNNLEEIDWFFKITNY